MIKRIKLDIPCPECKGGFLERGSYILPKGTQRWFWKCLGSNISTPCGFFRITNDPHEVP